MNGECWISTAGLLETRGLEQHRLPHGWVLTNQLILTPVEFETKDESFLLNKLKVMKDILCAASNSSIVQIEDFEFRPQLENKRVDGWAEE